MKFFILFPLMLIALVGYTSAQRCIGMPRNRSCRGARDVGRSGPRCTPVTTWHWNGRTCDSMRYLGCGGNNNRWCTRGGCERICRRRH